VNRNIIHFGYTFDVFHYLAMSDGGVPSNQGYKLQGAIYYAIDGDQINIMNMLAQKMEKPWVKIIFGLCVLILLNI
jgi:hypothetical protein